MIARALVHEPKLLILDEPTAGVDIEIRHQMWNFLVDLNKSGKTILLTSHYLEEIERLCKSIAIINEGKIIVADSVKNVLNNMSHETYVLELQKSYPLKDLKFDHIKVIDKQTLELSIKPSSDLGEIIAMLVASGLKIKSIQSKQNRLEELFLQVTKK
jgi:ABC-2 type transport system ATP-binding protein